MSITIESSTHLSEVTPITEVFRFDDEEELVPNLPTALVVTAYMFIGFLIVIGNSLVLAVVYRHKAMRVTTSILVGSLALADMMIGCFVVPSTIISFITGSESKGTVMCQVVPYIQLTSVSATIASMVMIAIERYHVILRIEQQPYTVKHTVMMVSLGWCLSGLYGLRVFIPTGEDEGGSTKVCDALNEDEGADIYLRIADLVVLVLVPFAVMSVLYGLIIRRLREHRHVPTTGQKKGYVQKELAVKV